jgi:SAM-dependent methyltransferase
MNYYKRVKERIKKEGFIRTLEYICYVCFTRMIDCICITWLDLRYSRRFLNGNIKTSYKHLGANDVYHTKYSAMPLIFHLVPIRRSDVLVDVGCGKGRVINFWLSRKLTNKIYGLELDTVIAQKTAKQFAKRENVTILEGDAIENLPSNGTLFYFYNPFMENKVVQFEEKLSTTNPNKQIKIVYYNPKSIHVFQNEKWNIKYINFEHDLGIIRWGRINKFHDLAIITRKL